MNRTSHDQDLPHWREAGAYGYCGQLTSRGWAWEFLRRNPEFERDLDKVSLGVAVSKVRSVDVARLPTDAVDLSRWGLLFCQLDQT